MASGTRRLRDVPWEALRVDLALPRIGRVLAGSPAEREVDKALRAARELTRSERAALVEAIFGVALWRRRLAFHTGSEDPRVLLFALLRDLAGRDDAGALCGVEPAPALRAAPEGLADRFSLPDWLAALFVRELGSEGAAAFSEAICAPGPVCLRANTLRCTREELAARLGAEGLRTRPTLLARDGLVVETQRPNLLALESARDGLFEAQDEGSQLLGELVQAEPGETVLDLCAGAGGKSLQLAAQLQNRGLVIAHDIDQERLQRLARRAARAGASCIEVAAPREADRVLVDAPCSELGTLRRGPDARWRASEADAAQLPALQRALLERAAPLARKRLVYATCTLRREENEDLALAFERAHPEFRREPPTRCATPDGFFRCLPHLHDTDAFFAAIWHR
jgi:16S rRNA (cytosine967-C5)-methyltransferase